MGGGQGMPFAEEAICKWDLTVRASHIRALTVVLCTSPHVTCKPKSIANTTHFHDVQQFKMTYSQSLLALPADLEVIFSTHKSDPVALIGAFMPALCDHLNADRIFVQPRNPDTRICKVMRWRRNEGIPW